MFLSYKRDHYINNGTRLANWYLLFSGAHSLYIAKSGRQVVAVDPLDINVHRIMKTVSLNKINNFKLVQNAISDNHQNLRISIRPHNVGSSSIESFVDDGSIQETSTILMDDLLEVIAFKEAIIKIDIEGSEAKAFCHSDRLFEEVYVHAIFMEWSHINKMASKSDKNTMQFYIMLGTLAKHGYKPYELQDGSYYLLKMDNQFTWPANVVWLKE